MQKNWFLFFFSWNSFKKALLWESLGGGGGEGVDDFLMLHLKSPLQVCQ